MSLKMYNPFQGLERIDNAFKHFDGFYRPATDVFESNNEFIVKVNLPGFTKDNISINATLDVLEIKAEISNISSDDSEKENEETQTDVADEKWIPRHIERLSRNYYRKLKFNKPIDTQNAKVELDNGVLTVTLPIRAEAKKVTLEIV